MTGEPDYIARVLAILALLFTAAQMIIAWRRDVWRRRATNSAALKDTLAEVQPVLTAADTPLGAANLWTGAIDLHMASMLEELAEVPDLQLGRQVRRLHKDLVRIRGMSTPTNTDLLGPGVTLNGEQRRLLEDARLAAAACAKRIGQSIRRGGRHP